MTTILFTTVGYNSWIVPADWDNNNNCFEAIAGGGSGINEPAGGGGGGYARSNNLVCTPGRRVYVYVGAGGRLTTMSDTGIPGGQTWISTVSNAIPTLATQGVRANGGAGGSWSSGGGSIAGKGGNGMVGQVKYTGGDGNHDTFNAGGGGGAAGPHGDGQDAYIAASRGHGGAGDAGYGGAGGVYTANYESINAGQPGPNNSSGGGGAYYGAVSTRTGRGGAGFGGNYGGGGGGNYGTVAGAQGIAKITYTPYVVPPPPNPPPPPPPNTTPNTPPPVQPPPPPCIPSGFLTQTPAQVYWSYGQWTDPWNNINEAHYDSNYKQLVTLAGDNDTNTYDIQYNSTTPWDFENEKENFYHDYPRIWKSRSNELLEDSGKRSVWMRHRTIIGDADCVPNIDPASGYVTLLSNQLFMDEETYGYRLSYANNKGYFNPGDLVVQSYDGGTSYAMGRVLMMDPNYIYVNFPVGPMLAGYDLYNPYNYYCNAHITAVVEMDEKYSANVFPGQTRYICKSTVLEPGMDAEELQCFATVYRPPNTNFKVYGKIISAADPGKYNDRIWSRLWESNATSTSYSSLTNTKDYVSIKYKLPPSVLVFSNAEGAGCNNELLEVTVPSVDRFAAGDFIYLTDASTGTFNIRKIINIPNNDTLVISSTPSFSNTTAVNIGIIPGLEDPTAAFLYDQTGVARYVTNNDVTFEMFNQFAIKIVPISDNPVICPVMTEFRAVACQATAM